MKQNMYTIVPAIFLLFFILFINLNFNCPH